MTHSFTRTFHIRHYELDSMGHVNNAVYLNYLQQTAMEASSKAGYSTARYDEMGTMWLVRKTIVEHARAATYEDELAVKTWISNFKRVQCNREYLMTNVQTGETILRGQTNWAYLNKDTQRPIRIPPEMIEAFAPSGHSSIRHPKPGRGEKPTSNAPRFMSHRRVQYYELDTVNHVNNAVYLNWVEQAFFDACAKAGFSRRAIVEQHGVIFIVRRNEIDYHLPALSGDEIEISSWVNSMARTHGTWIHEMHRRDSGQLLVRVHAMGAFVNPEGKPIRLPEALRVKMVGEG